MIRFIFCKKIPNDIRQFFKLCRPFILEEIDVQHTIKIKFVDTDQLTDMEGFKHLGHFLIPERRKDEVQIVIAGLFIPDKCFNRNDVFHALLTTVMHELIHYDQWRLKKDVNEYGVEVKSQRCTHRIYAKIEELVWKKYFKGQK